jgi:drug/metabolite transporter (DMT)-like permease
MKSALEHVSPFELLALRNVVGLLALCAIWVPGMWASREKNQPIIDTHTTRAGVVMGLALAAGLALQVVGLQTTTSVKAGFISGLYVVFTPFVAIPILRRFPSAAVVAAAGGAGIGLFMLTVGDPRSLGSVARGDVLNLFAALGFALHVALTGRYAPRCDYKRLALIEAAVKAAVFSFALFGLDLRVLLVRDVVIAVVVTGLGATALGLAVQTWAQRKVSAPATAVILSSEPAFAGIFGYLLLGEALTRRGLIGAVIMLGAIVAAARTSDEKVVAVPS